jgi:xanthine dehydrogenase accessory factor
MSDAEYYARVAELLLKHTPFVSVILVDTAGSVPQDAGRKMLVTSDGLLYGTVGGGKVEKKAIEEAQRLLTDSSGEKATHFVNWSLSRDVGMTCGGAVKLYFETHNINTWNVVIFGAGHIANALMNLLVKLEASITCIDPRQEWLDKLPDSPKLRKVLAEDMPAQVATLPDDAFVALMTMGHSSDKPILLEIFRQGRRFPYLGVIGSAAKAARIYKDIAEAGLPADLRDAFYCPMGLDIGTNHPYEIAVSMVAQLIQERDKFRAVGNKADRETSCETSDHGRQSELARNTNTGQ